MRDIVFLGALLAALACARSEAPQSIPPGEARLAVPDGTIWYKVSGTGTATPLVLLHGGPGFSSFYLKPFETLADDRQVIRYDQLGGGKSGPMTDTSLMNIGHFVAELDSLRAALGIERWHVLGHSWGTMLGIEYYRAHPDRVASLTFGSPVFDIPAYAAHARELQLTLSDSAQRAIRQADATGAYEDPHYQNAINEFYGLYVFRHPVPADLDSTFATVNQAVYTYMQGPSEFTITGTFKDFNVTGFLPQVRVPTLLTVGEFDEVGPALVRTHAALIPGARFEVLPGSAHITTWDAPEANLRVVREFLHYADSVDSQARKAP